MASPIITVEHLSKAYRLGVKEEVPDTLVGAVTSWMGSPIRNWKRLRRLNTSKELRQTECKSTDTLWALTDVSFEVHQGEVIGIIGRNGAGKSTLLKILSRITQPTKGRITIRGRVSSLLEVGTGFHPELSGRENVYMNGTILGMRKREIDQKFDEIVDFSGVERFLDTPIKRYSSGMQVRLAFAVAAHLEPEILIVDEVLAVGDIEFQQKCSGKMSEISGSGRTVLFVSHNMVAVQALCKRGILFHGGRIELDVSTDEAIKAYLDRTHSGRVPSFSNAKRRGSQEVSITDAQIIDDQGRPTNSIPMGKAFAFRIQLQSIADVRAASLIMGLYRADGVRICGFDSQSTDRIQFDLNKGERMELTCHIEHPNLCDGSYSVNLQCKSSSGGAPYDFIESGLRFEITPANVFGTGRLPPGNNAIFMPATWTQRSI